MLSYFFNITSLKNRIKWLSFQHNNFEYVKLSWAFVSIIRRVIVQEEQNTDRKILVIVFYAQYTGIIYILKHTTFDFQNAFFFVMTRHYKKIRLPVWLSKQKVHQFSSAYIFDFNFSPSPEFIYLFMYDSCLFLYLYLCARICAKSCWCYCNCVLL